MSAYVTGLSKFLDAPGEGTVRVWRAARKRKRRAPVVTDESLEQALEGMVEFVRESIRTAEPEDIETVVDELLDDPRYLQLREHLQLTPSQRIEVLQAWDEPEPEGVDAELDGKLLHLDRVMKQVFRLQLVLVAELASRPSQARMLELTPKPFAVLESPEIAPTLQSAVIAGVRLDLLVGGLVMIDRGEIDSRVLAQAIVDAAIRNARRFLALLVFIVDQETDLNSKVGADVLPTGERIFADHILAETEALKSARRAALDDARSRAG